MNICSYNTYKKREKFILFRCYDGGGKAFSESVAPTLLGAGFSFVTEEIELDLFGKEKPKEIAVRSIYLVCSEEYIKTHQFVYYAKYASGYYYYDSLVVYSKPL